ncbi:hypothetical protein M2337_003418 [Sphingobium sp. B2D3A]|uniref:hypothetical protein n=1 Tax=unclassified Sphingobium TaxID=2611147 RepID=UPI0022251864|nr:MULTISPECIES: hypothetical protein [unclassified Sphingobium]MCW2339128.1 hypothetical protein [Sphingobium sp. B2D3A]MCW2386928.1 hypothetical protein [Sphingobium sp. B2D3D]
MARPKKIANSLEAIAAQRAELQERMAALDAAERAAREAAQDEGRDVLMKALERVKIPAMDRSNAKAIAKAIATLEASEIVRRIGA